MSNDAVMFELAGIPQFLEEPTDQGEQQQRKIDLDLFAAGQLLVEDAKLWPGQGQVFNGEGCGRI